MNFANEILDSIEIMVKKAIDDKSTKIYTGVCKSVSSNGTCSLEINGNVNTVRYYGGTPKSGDVYRVFVPSNNMSAAFIIIPGDGGDTPVTAVTSYNDLTDKPSVNSVTLSGNKSSADLGLYGTNNIPPYPVTSVNHKTGAITLTASDIGALSDDTTIPTVNDATLTIQKNGTSVGTFSANASSNKTVNITVPTNNDELTNGAGYITESALTPYAKTVDVPTKTSDLTNDSNYITSSGVPVQSVNTKTGAVVLTQDDIGDGTTYVRTHNDFTDALKQQINTNEGNIAMIDSDVGALETDVSKAKSDITSLTTALNSKQDTITGAGSTITENNLTANRVVVSNNSGKIAVSDITSTELGYLDGVTSNIQTQLDGKLSSAPVTSVNTKTGAVVLSASDVGAISTSDISQTLGTSTIKVPSEKAVSDAITSAGGGDMMKAVYDPNSTVADAGGIVNYVDANGGKIDTIKVNGAAQTITNKTVDISVPTNTSQLTNGAGFITSSQAPVQSVNGQTGAVVIDVDLSTVLKLTGGTMQGIIDMGGYKITNVATPTNNTDAANKAYADAQKGVEVLTQSTQPTDQVNGDMWFQTT